ncbi:MAG: tetratricopeptide repeat protein [Luteitalea sp.]|nr:tetratricopeptide repeat protein [Luteitalea sp.]
MLSLPLVLLLGISPLGVQSPSVPAEETSSGPPADGRPSDGAAYYEFLQARRLEDQGDVEGAVAALRRATEHDPASAEVFAELAALHARQNQAEEAMAAAGRATALDPDNSQAHWVLGIVNAALARAARENEGSEGSEAAAQAITHLEKALPGRPWDIGATLTLGRLYLETDDHDKAIALLTKLLDREATVSEAALLLAQAHEQAGDPKRAMGALDSVVPGDPQYFGAQVAKGELLERRGDWAGAAAAYGRALEHNPAATDVRLRQAAVLLGAKRPADARTLLEEAAKEKPANSRVLYLLSEAQRESGDLAAAEATARQLVEAAPKDARGAYALAQVFEERREYQAVIDALAPFADPAPTAPQPPAEIRTDLLLRLAFAKQQTGGVDEAIDLFERAKARGPSTPLFDAFIAQAYLLDEQYDRALTATRAARKRWPEDPRLVRLEARALQGTGEVEPAVALLEQQARREPDDVSHVVALGAMLAQSQQFDRAVAVVSDARTRFPRDATLGYQLGAIYHEARRYDEAERAFRAVLEIDPRHAPTLNDLGYMFADRGVRLNEAVKLLQQAVKLDPYNGSYLDSLGWAYFKQRRLDLARDHLQKAATQLTNNSVVQDHLGDLLFALNDREAAIEAWERALTGDGESVVPSDIKDKIQRARQE